MSAQGEENAVADFDPFANQGGPAAWDPEHSTDMKKQADELNRRLAADNEDPGVAPSSFSGDDSDELIVDDDDQVSDEA